MDLGADPLVAYRIASRICEQESIPAKRGRTTVFSFTTVATGGRKIVSGDLFEPEPSVEYSVTTAVHRINIFFFWEC